MRMVEDVEFVEIHGKTFPENMRLLWVNLQQVKQNVIDNTIFFTKCFKLCAGTIVRKYSEGSWIPVIVDITTNHGGYFIFKLCHNDDITKDPDQDCFDEHILQVCWNSNISTQIEISMQ